MDEEQTRPFRGGPQFSLLTILLLMALVASGITIVLLWREVGPLRAELRSLRTELGFLNIEDPTKAHAIALQTSETRIWKWRIYLPPNVKYRYACYSGRLPDPQKLAGPAWFDRVINGGVGSGISGTMNSGEFTLEARLVKEGEQWQLRTLGSGGNGGFITSIHPSDWFSSRHGLNTMSGVSPREQTEFARGEPILLLKVLRPIVTTLPSGAITTTTPQGESDGFVFWIEKEKPAAPLKGATP
jgi:hypothetical protein